MFAEDDDEPEVRIVERVEPVVERAAERLEQADVVEAPVAGRARDAGARARMRSPAGCGHERGGRAQERLGALVHAEAELVLEAHRAQEAQRIVDEDRARTRPGSTPASRSARPSCGSYGSPGRDVLGDRVEREVARREIGVDPVRQRREVDRLVDAVGDDAPGAVSLGERERRAAEAAREAMRGVARIRAGDVEVEHRPQEQLVAHGAADDPGVLAAQDLADALIHRSRPAGRGPSAC